MQIIREEDGLDIFMIPLFHDWKIRRCNQKDCKEQPNTIITGASKDVTAFGLCEAHFQQGNVPNGTKYNLEFDDFDAFKVRQLDSEAK